MSTITVQSLVSHDHSNIVRCSSGDYQELPGLPGWSTDKGHDCTISSSSEP